MEIYYFGCAIGSKGHYPFKPGMNQLSYEETKTFYPKFKKHPDSQYCPEPVGHRHTMGRYEVVRENDWTILSFWDSSEDSRPGSHSTFLIKIKDISNDEALAYCENSFPEVFKRARDKGYTIIEVER